MKYDFIGVKTGKIYATGYKNECFRKLKEQYPSFKYYSVAEQYEKGVEKKASLRDPVYPEPIILRPIK